MYVVNNSLRALLFALIPLGIAHAVLTAMVLLGVTEKQIETVSFGAEKPVGLGRDEDSWAKNRRADLVYPNEPQ